MTPRTIRMAREIQNEVSDKIKELEVTFGELEKYAGAIL
jgi:hypothetical protein